MLKMVARSIVEKKISILFLLMSLVFFLLFLFFSQRGEISYSYALLKNFMQGKGYKDYVKHSISTNIDEDTHLKMTLLIPYKKAGQAKKLKKMAPQLNHELIIHMSSPEFKKLVTERNFSELKKHLIEIVIEITGESIETVYYDAITVF